jgi:hypothetical protein
VQAAALVPADFLIPTPKLIKLARRSPKLFPI